MRPGYIGQGPRIADFDLRAWPPPWRRADQPGPRRSDAYSRLEEAGLAYGPDFRGLEARGSTAASYSSRSRCPRTRSGTSIATVCIRRCSTLLSIHSDSQYLSRDKNSIQLPVTWEGVGALRHWHHGAARALHSKSSEGAVSIAIADATGEPVALVETLVTRPAAAELVREALVAQRFDGLYAVEWSIPLDTGAVDSSGEWAVVGDDGGIELAATLCEPRSTSASTRASTRFRTNSPPASRCPRWC